ncbi:phosphocholine cytidylyltransferase family protein [Serpentinicella sp. ANB-PHB4]|uniref:phosphocholine cytidylyltransferase family protein n=1 Tax=Serpentinicella sp. ANB-PHB4 TaxID=3074076 RepID=UPI00285427C1|nr:phosphocholine cytidylyltransferase family protein [Serpentinicella sp. ANB-PHB4]MDR5659786.1 phosphocholine cytidylyltransferase family protein [Serpentinicella sp. ANB-PHB4]
MKTIILAAGEGKRLRPFTEDKPKCMVLYREKPIINYILDAIDEKNLQDIGIVTGYKDDVLRKHIKKIYTEKNVDLYHNPKYHSTNMVQTLFCAESYFDCNKDLIVSYADIIYNQNILTDLIKDDSEISVVVDKNWKELWEMRMDNPLEDAESMKIDNEGYIRELGKKPRDYSDIDGQYIGLIKISKRVIEKVKSFYHNLDKNRNYDGKNFNNMYMTTFIQLLINKGFKVKAVEVYGGWLEIDTTDDLKILEEYFI